MSRGQGSHMNWCLDCKVYVGDLGYGAAKQEIEDIFSQYGPLRNVWVARNPPGFAFVEYQDPRDAKDAVRGLNGIKINGRKVRVEMSTGESRWGKRGPPMGRRGYRDSRDSRVRNDRSRSRSPVQRRRRSQTPGSVSRSPSPYQQQQMQYERRKTKRDARY